MRTSPYPDRALVVYRKTSLRFAFVMLWVVGLTGQGCSIAQSLLDGLAADGHQERPTRRIEVETDHPGRSLPCSVIYRPDPETRKVLWRAQFEEGFCRAKANESRLLLESKGWSCTRETSNRAIESDRSNGASRFVQAWNCEPVLETATSGNRPPAGRESGQSQQHSLSDQRLQAVVEEDIAKISWSANWTPATSAIVRGDLDCDGLDDAVVVLTREFEQQRWDQMTMAYLGSDDNFHLVDAQISPLTKRTRVDDLKIEIDGGVVRLTSCCGHDVERSSLILRGRKLTYSDDVDSSHC